METRTDIINYLIKKYQLTRYVEIGVQHHVNFNRVEAPMKVSVDPDPEAKATYCLTSDEFFEQYGSPSLQDQRMDIFFIDGMHTAEQVKKDTENAMQMLNPGGFIVLHDCLPVEEIHAKVPRESKVWNGSVYRFCFHLLFNYTGLKMFIVDIDHGCAVIMKSAPDHIVMEAPLDMQEHKMEDIDWQFYLDNRVKLPIYDPAHFKAMV